MSLDEDIRAFERAVESGDATEIAGRAPAVLRYMRLAATEKFSTPGQIASEIDRASGGIEGLLQVQESLKRYLDRPDGPVEFRLNSVWTNFENDSCVALFDNADAALAYFKSALLPKNLRYTDVDGRFRSFRSDSICYDYNPHGGDTSEEGARIMAIAVPWNPYSSYGRSPVRNPLPLTGQPPPTPADARIYQEADVS